MIEITAIKKYGNKTVLDVESLMFEFGKSYALIGANGSGKSTLLKIIDNQLKAKGTVDIKNKKVAYMPQNSYAFSMSVKQNILLPIKLTNIKQNKNRIQHLTKALDLTELLGKNAAKLSGGETQRMALARTLMVSADILLLDEPTAAMDVEQAKSVIDLLKSHSDKYKTTLIFATHSMNQAELLADEVLFLSNGKIAERGIPERVLHNPQSAELKAFISFNP